MESATNVVGAAIIIDDEETALLQAMERTVQESLQYYMYANAIFYAERLHELRPEQPHYVHLLADCYARNGDAQTAYSLLHHHYPFFPPSITTTTAAAASNADTTNRGSNRVPGVLRGAGVLSNTPPPPSSSSSSSPPSLATHRRVASATSGGIATSHAVPILPSRLTPNTTTTPATTTTTIREPQRIHGVGDVLARWNCQYLLGVLCYQTERFAEGRWVLLELRQVCAMARRLVSQRVSSCEPNALESMMSLPAGTLSPGSAAYATLTRIAEVEYWLAMCERRMSLDQSSDTFLHAVHDNPRLFVALEEYVATASPPSERCVQIYKTTPQQSQPFMSPPVYGPSVEMSPRRPGATGLSRGVTSPPSSFVTRKRPASAQSERDDIRRAPEEGEVGQRDTLSTASDAMGHEALCRFLLQYARASYLLHVYRCAEARQWLTQHCITVQHDNENSDDALSGGNRARLRDSSHTRETMGLWAQTQFALAHFHDGNMAESAAAFAELLQRAPWRLNERALIFYSTALWQLKDESTLGALAQQLTETLPLSVVTLCVVANMFSLAKEPQEALTMLQRATEVDATVAYAHALRGYELLYLDRKTEAAEAFKTAIGIDRNLYVAYAGLGEMHMRAEEITFARRYFRQAIGINPLPTIMNRYAATFHSRGATRDDLDDALRIYQSSIQLHPNNLAARLQRADVLLRLGRYDEAHKELTGLQHVCAKEAMWHVMMARCMQYLGQPKLAIHYYTYAMKLDPRREGYIRTCMEKLNAGTREEVVI